jgi:hypothetical protein
LFTAGYSRAARHPIAAKGATVVQAANFMNVGGEFYFDFCAALAANAAAGAGCVLARVRPQLRYPARMKIAAFEAIAGALNRAGVRYLVAGGLAVNAHGYVRLTQDVDLVVQLDRGNILAAFAALEALGYRALVPVTGEQFADRAQREQWIREKGMEVLNFHSERYRTETVDIFVTEPFAFDAEYARALEAEIAPGISVRFVSIPTLIEMKRLADRPRDRDDIEHLQMILEEQRRR